MEELDSIAEGDLRERIEPYVASDLDVTTGLILSEVARRKRGSPLCYPFDRQADLIVRTGNSLVYEFLLWLAASTAYRDEGRQSDVEPIFNGIAKHALRSLLGGNACAVHFSTGGLDGRPQRMPQAVQWLAGLLGLETAAGTPRARQNDGGVDVVAWRPFDDKQLGNPIVLCQCTVQKRRWGLKGQDVVFSRWRKWIGFDRDPLVALAVPFVSTLSAAEWANARETADVVLDRLRLVELVGGDALEDEEEIKAWIARELKLNSS